MFMNQRLDARGLVLILLCGCCFGNAEPGLCAADWPMWGGTPQRNNAPVATRIPAIWDVGEPRQLRREDGTYEKNPRYPEGRGPFVSPGSKNIKWAVRLGNQTYGNPSVSGGKVFIGTNNDAAYLERFSRNIDLGVLLCFDEQSGRFLWQYSSPKLPTGRVHDWPNQGMPSTPLVDGDRLWAVTNRCEVICLDTEGFRDQQNDGPFQSEPVKAIDEADVIWKVDMISELGVFPHNMSNCSMCAAEGRLFVCTSNGVDESHLNLPAPDAPSFLAMNRDTGEVLWTDNSPGTNILHSQWASPCYAVFDGRPQVIFPGGDGWLYSFAPEGDGQGHSKLLWKFDCNPKHAKWELGDRSTRNNLIGFACIYDSLVYIAAGQDPEHGEGLGHLWCIDPTKKTDGSDVSPELVVDAGHPVPQRRIQAIYTEPGWEPIFNEQDKIWVGLDEGMVSERLRERFAQAGVKLPPSCAVQTEHLGRQWEVSALLGDVKTVFRVEAISRNSGGRDWNYLVKVSRRHGAEASIPNPESAVVWHYAGGDCNGNGDMEWEEEMHRAIGTPAIKDDILYIGDFSGLFHCLDATTGKPLWIYDLLAQCWGSALIADGKVYIGDEDGDVAVFRHSADPQVAMKSGEPQEEIYMDSSVYSTPIVANNVLYLATKSTLYAIAPERGQGDAPK